MAINQKTRGLYLKYTVRRTDGRDLPGCTHEGCEYFVLDLTHDPHAPTALRAYAESCEADFPRLSAELRDKCERMPVKGGGREDASGKGISTACFDPEEA